MSEPFLSEIRWVSFNFAPKGWALCNGQTLNINTNQPLFALLGTTYGGNGQTTFALPNLQGRVANHMGQGFTLGERGGEEAHTVTQSEMPAHVHAWQATTADASQPAPANAYFAGSANTYTPLNNATTMHPQTVANAGGSQPHENRQPFLVLNAIIALQGIFPSRN